MIVADASIMLACIMHDESVPYADAALEFIAREGAIVPGNFPSEIANALLQAERRGRIHGGGTAAALTEILALPLTTEMPDPQFATKLAREHRLTCYDSFYLALAVECDSSLATVHEALAVAARVMNRYWEPLPNPQRRY